MSKLSDILGEVLLPMITPFDSNSKLNLEATEKLVNYLIEKNYMDSLIVTGTTGEFYALSFDERIQILRAVKEIVNGRIPIIAGTGSAYTLETIELTKRAEEFGYDCVMVVSPYYQKATQEGLYQHFRAVAESTRLPVMLYNIPLFTGVNIEAETLARLVRISNIKAIKEEAGINPIQTTDFRIVAPPDFTIYCGDDTMVLQTLPQGAVGVVSGGSHVIGDMMKQMIRSYKNGENTMASELYFKMMPFLKALNQNGRVNPIPLLKDAVTISSGIDVGKPRLPSLGATEAEKSLLKRVLSDIGRLSE
ncbi:MAG TPA: 4-hydroxy-tetrahydrodipicolinate synthase [Firmicutes bacterium]|nr:4-hydroxy-tetrahydrodipicolinate synthase [Bacillota bacterium]